MSVYDHEKSVLIKFNKSSYQDFRKESSIADFTWNQFLGPRGIFIYIM